MRQNVGSKKVHVTFFWKKKVKILFFKYIIIHMFMQRVYFLFWLSGKVGQMLLTPLDIFCRAVSANEADESRESEATQ